MSTGCKCAQCYGLAEYMADHTGSTYGLPAAPGHNPHQVTLRVLTTGPQPDNLVALPEPRVCDGTMTCLCDECQQERARRVRQGVRPSPQPWHGKKAA